MTRPYPRRITVVGNSGSGKSTLSEQLGKELKMPVRHLDLILWQADWVCRTEAEFAADHDAWVAKPTWIIEGVGHWSTLEKRFTEADFIVFLDTPRGLCVERAEIRMSEDCLVPNHFVPEGCRYETVADRQWAVINHFDASLRPALLKLLESNFSEKPHAILDGRLSPEELLEVCLSELGGSSSVSPASHPSRPRA